MICTAAPGNRGPDWPLVTPQACINGGLSGTRTRGLRIKSPSARAVSLLVCGLFRKSVCFICTTLLTAYAVKRILLLMKTTAAGERIETVGQNTVYVGRKQADGSQACRIEGPDGPGAVLLFLEHECRLNHYGEAVSALADWKNLARIPDWAEREMRAE